MPNYLKYELMKTVGPVVTVLCHSGWFLCH